MGKDVVRHGGVFRHSGVSRRRQRRDVRGGQFEATRGEVPRGPQGTEVVQLPERFHEAVRGGDEGFQKPRNQGVLGAVRFADHHHAGGERAERVRPWAFPKSGGTVSCPSLTVHGVHYW